MKGHWQSLNVEGNNKVKVPNCGRSLACLLIAAVLLAPMRTAAQKISLTTLPSADTTRILARIAGKTIFIDEFIRRAEYTVRPSYCRGTGGIEKKIILNSLLAEKMLSLEAGNDNELLKSESFRRKLQGRKEKLMRNVLYYAEGKSKVRLDSVSLRNEYRVAGRTYHVEYFSVPDDSAADVVRRVLAASPAVFSDVYRALSGQDTLPKRDVGWASRENRNIREALFGSRPPVNQIVGPVRNSDGSSLFMRVEGWTDIPAITQKQVSDRWADVREELTRIQADRLYDRYILRVMKGKKIRFDPAVFKPFVETAAPRYLATKKEDEESLLDQLYVRPPTEKPELAAMDRELGAIGGATLFTIDGKAWTVNDVLIEMECHPLVFRTRNLHKKNIAKQIELALADMVRDRYLAQEAYKRAYDKYPTVIHYTAMWSDALVGLWKKQLILASSDLHDDGSEDIVRKILNPIMDSLRHKYGDRVEVNTEEFNGIELTGIPMVVLENNVPFPVFMPGFPETTTYAWLDYGKRMNAGKRETTRK